MWLSLWYAKPSLLLLIETGNQETLKLPTPLFFSSRWMFVAKRCLVFNCVGGFKEGMSSVLFRFYLLVFWAARESCPPVGFPGNSPWLSGETPGGGKNPDLNVAATRIPMSKARQPKGHGRASPADQQPPCRPPASLLSPSLQQEDGTGLCPSLLLPVLSQRAPRSSWHTPQAVCGWRRGHQGPIVRGLPFPTYPSFCLVQYSWGGSWLGGPYRTPWCLSPRQISGPAAA